LNYLKRVLFIFIIFLTPSLGSSFIEIPSQYTVTDCVNKIIKSIDEKHGFKVFAVVDHEKNAMSVSMKLPQTVLIIFGNPKGGTKLMQANPLMAYELPLKILLTHKRGKTIISYRDPNWFSNVYGLYGSPVIKKLHQVMKSIVSSCL